VTAGDIDHGVDVAEVDELRDVRLGKSGGFRVAVDRDDAKSTRARLSDRTALVPAGADEENRLHDGKTLRVR
jgi:hypothetical protein